ncbi:MAG: hypothetical protein JJU36_03370 [Phycisphaeraceae bacterium]|nr:hypothetical protein [Phycisphaeraceae bacterium]
MKTRSMKDILPHWTALPPITHGKLTLVPLKGTGDEPRFRDYLLSTEAIERGTLTITEVSDSGSVPELMAINKSDDPVLLIDGEELRGAKQNRILNTSILLRPKSRTQIPVSCVEQGRWSSISSQLVPGSISPSAMRGRKSRVVMESLRSSGRAESDQGAIWDDVGAFTSQLRATSPTGAMSDSFQKIEDQIKAYEEAMPFPEGACGVVAAIAGGFVALDAFDSPATLRALWPRLVASYAMDAEVNRSKKRKAFTQKAVGALVEHLAEQTCEALPSVGLGRDLRFEAESNLGQGLRAQKTLLHLSVFPSDPDQSDAQSRSIRFSPPSRRRRTRLD